MSCATCRRVSGLRRSLQSLLGGRGAARPAAADAERPCFSSLAGGRASEPLGRAEPAQTWRRGAVGAAQHLPLAPASACASARSFHATPLAAALGGRRDGSEEGGDEAAALDASVQSPPPERDLLAQIQAMSRKQQQFQLTQLLRGRSSLRADHAASEEAEDRTFDMQVIDVNRTIKVTKGGSLQRFSALVVVGNGDGVVGWAMGKSPEVGAAIDKAYARASRSLFYLERFDGHTIFHETSAKYGRSLVTIAPLPSGSGLKANTTIAAICRLAGIKDVRAKVLGSHNPHTTLRAAFEALDAVRSPEEVSIMRGRTVIRLSPTTGGGE